MRSLTLAYMPAVHSIMYHRTLILHIMKYAVAQDKYRFKPYKPPLEPTRNHHIYIVQAIFIIYFLVP